MPSDNFLTLLEAEKPNILARLPKLNEYLTPERWWAITYDISRSQKLQKVGRENPYSLIDALKRAADLGLELDGEEAFINVYNEKQANGGWLPVATTQPMYKGMVRVAVEAGAIAHAVPDVIRDGDIVEEVSDEKGRRIVHKRAFNAKPNRKVIGAYCQYWLPNGLMDFELFEMEDIEAAKAASLRNAQRNNKDAKLSPAWQFTPWEMAKVKVLRRGLKRMKGKRGPHAEATDRLAAVLEESRHFDAETTAEEEAPDNLPQAMEAPPESEHEAESRRASVALQMKRDTTTKLVADANTKGAPAAHLAHADADPPSTSATLTIAEQREQIAYCTANHIPFDYLDECLRLFGVSDLSQLLCSDLPEFQLKLMEKGEMR